MNFALIIRGRRLPIDGESAPNGSVTLLCGNDVLKTFGTETKLKDIVAHYSGLFTLVNTWFGKLMKKLDTLGLRENTWVIFASDHGTNFADNLEHTVGKPARALYPGVMHVSKSADNSINNSPKN